MKSTSHTPSCSKAHNMIMIKGKLMVKVDADGKEIELVAGDVAYAPPGHDAWVVGDEAVVLYDFEV